MFLKLIIRNTLRHKLRTFLTILSVVIAILAFGLLQTFINAWYQGVEASSTIRLITRNAVSLAFPLPISYKERIRKIDGVKIVSWGTWFGGVYKDEKNFFPSFAIDAKSYLELYPEYLISEREKKEFFRDRKGFIAGKKLAERFGWKIGDIITLKGKIFPGDWEFILRGIYRGRDEYTDETQFFFHWDYLNEVLRKRGSLWADHVGWYMIGITNPDGATDISLLIDKMFKNSVAETLTETEKAFQLSFISMTETILILIRIVSLVVILIIIAVVANTMSMTYRERIQEYAIFKTLGYRGMHIGTLILGESLFLTMIGCITGIASTYPIAKIVGKMLEVYFPVFIVPTEVVYYDVIVSIIVGLISSTIPAYNVVKIRIVEGLRSIG